MAEQQIDDRAGARVVRGVVAGAVAGLVAAFAMDRFQAAASALSSSGASGGEPSTEQAADAVSTALAGGPLAPADKPLGGQALHYALGAGLGVAYGIAAEFRPGVTAGRGAAFGIGAATLLDEGAVPALGLGEAPWRASAGSTLFGYLSHLVFGAVAEVVRAQVRATLLPSS